MRVLVILLVLAMAIFGCELDDECYYDQYGIFWCDDMDGDGWYYYEDCDDYDPSIHPGAFEYFDYRDNDCDGVADEYY